MALTTVLGASLLAIPDGDVAVTETALVKVEQSDGIDHTPETVMPPIASTMCRSPQKLETIT